MIHLSEATTCAFVQGFLAIRADDGAEIVLDEDEVQKLREALEEHAKHPQD